VNAARRLAALVRESLATARSQPVASLVTLVMVAGMCSTVLLTTGRTVGAEQAILGSIDSAGTRSIVVRADAEAGLSPSVLENLKNIEGIEWSAAFGPATDAVNAAIPGGAKVPVRRIWSDFLATLPVPDSGEFARSAWASQDALDSLGLSAPSGGLIGTSGEDFSVQGQLNTPSYLAFLEPLVVVPSDGSTESARVSVLIVIATRPDLVGPVADALKSLLAVDDPSKLTVTTSEGLASLRAVVEGTLGSYGRNLILIVFSMTSVLVAAILYGLVMLRRKDFGRRRALGASQRLIVALLLVQVGALAFFGSVVGSSVAAAALAISGDPLPRPDFFAAVGVLAVFVSTLAAVLPALAAARRDPLKELRVP